MKKLVLTILATLMTVVLGTGSAFASQELPVNIEGAIFSGTAGDSIALTLNFDTGWLTEGDNTVFSKDLAAFSAILSTDTYFRTKDLDKGAQNRVLYKGENPEEYTWTSLLYKLGFDDVAYVESFKTKEYEFDSNDSATLLMGYMSTEDGCDLYVCAIRGSFSAGEWISAFDPGCDSESYRALTGEHPEWINKNHLKGADIGANRAMEFIEEFMAAHDNPNQKDVALLTGHSRGGILAEIIGASMEADPGVTAFTYTFNAVPVTTDSEALNYKTIFNIFDANDFYTDLLPFGEEQLYRYGTDISTSITDSDEIKTAIAELKGKDDYASVSNEIKEEYKELFGQRFTDRESLYEPVIQTQLFDTKEAAEVRLAECMELIGSESGLGLEGIAHMGEIKETEEGKYQLDMEYYGAAVLVSYAKLLAYGQAAYEATVDLFCEDELACQIADLMMNNGVGIQGGHLLINGYVLSQFVEKEESTDVEAITEGEKKTAEESITPTKIFEGGTATKIDDITIVNLSGTWHEMGRQYGALAKEELGDVFAFCEDIIEAGAGNADRAQEITAVQEAQMPYTIRDFFNGAAETSGLSDLQLLAANAVERIAGLPTQCSMTAVWDDYATNQMIVGRNYDYGEIFKALKDDVLVTIFNPADGALSTAIISYAGEIYAVNGMNEAGLFLELNNGTPSAPKQLIEDRITGTTLLLDVLFEADSLEFLDRYFNTMRCSSSYIINVLDGNDVRSYEWCQVAVKHGEDFNEEGLLVSTNHYVNPEWDLASPTDETSWNSFIRRNNLIQQCEENKGNIDAEVMQQIITTPVEEGGSESMLTVYQIVAEPLDQVLFIKTVESQHWARVDLKDYWQ